MQAFSYNFFEPPYNAAMGNLGRPAKKQRASFGARLVAAREEAGLTQNDLAERVGVTQRVIAYWERESVSLKVDQLIKLSDALNVSVDFLLGRTESKKKAAPVGKARRVFEKVSQLPKYQQQRIVSVVEDMVEAAHSRHSKAS